MELELNILSQINYARKTSIPYSPYHVASEKDGMKVEGRLLLDTKKGIRREENRV